MTICDSPADQPDTIPPLEGSARPSAAPPKQIRRLLDYIEAAHPNSTRPGESAADWAIRVLGEQRAVVSLATALVEASGVFGPPCGSSGSERPAEGLQPYQRKCEIVAAIRVAPGLDNYGPILALVPEDRYKVTASGSEIAIKEVSSGEVLLAWPTDWLVRTPTGCWTVVENHNFTSTYGPLMSVAREES